MRAEWINWVKCGQSFTLMHSIILSIAGGAQMKSMNQKDDKRME